MPPVLRPFLQTLTDNLFHKNTDMTHSKEYLLIKYSNDHSTEIFSLHKNISIGNYGKHSQNQQHYSAMILRSVRAVSENSASTQYPSSITNIRRFSCICPAQTVPDMPAPGYRRSAFHMPRSSGWIHRKIH